MLKRTVRKLSKILKRGERAYNTLVLASMIGMEMISNVYATPVLISGTVTLFKTMTTWLLLIIPVGAGAVLGYQALQKSLTDDQGVIGEKNKMMKNVIIGAAIAETASGLVTIILGFY